MKKSADQSLMHLSSSEKCCQMQKAVGGPAAGLSKQSKKQSKNRLAH